MLAQQALSDLELSQALAEYRRPRRLDVVLASPPVRAVAEALFPELTVLPPMPTVPAPQPPRCA